jgi:Fuc2NAc and GlcNAc transferase
MTLPLVMSFMLALVASVVLILPYRRLAVRRGIVARPGTRTLHEAVVPRGGGIVLATVFTAGVGILWGTGAITTREFLLLGIGGAAAALVGFVDDVLDVRVSIKLLLQALLASWAVGVLFDAQLETLLGRNSPVVAAAIVAAALFVPIWLINLFNFIDGIDGLAGTAAVLVAISIGIALLIRAGDRSAILPLVLIIATSLGFLAWNLPPARVFMGDAGSIFLGYAFAALLLWTVVSGALSIWSWFAALGYYFGDTTVTNSLRPFMVKHFYRGHRSHAYQNLARIHSSHARVTWGIVGYQLAWALPLCVWSALQPERGWVAAALSVTPAMLWTLRFGPLLSRD